MTNPIFDFYRGKRVLVTGHTGFKGSWLCGMPPDSRSQGDRIQSESAYGSRLCFRFWVFLTAWTAGLEMRNWTI